MKCNAKLRPDYFSVNVFLLVVVFRRQISKKDFFRCFFPKKTRTLMPLSSIKLSWFQRKSNKINIILYGRAYLQNCKAITFGKMANHGKYRKPNVPSHLHIFWLNFDKANHSFLRSFLLLGETDFRKNAAWSNE